MICYHSDMRFNPDQALKEFSQIFIDNGYTLYLVGGAVRDFLLREENHDYDFTTDAEPEDIKGMFKRTIDTGIKHGTVTVVFKKQHFEVTTFRTEGGYHDSRHPDSVTFVKSLEEDLKRRDFTINAMAVELPSGKIIDLNDGRKDLRRKLIRAIGNPEERFREDALRMMRACRFSSQLGFDIEKETLLAIESLSHTIRNISAERIKEELFRLIDGKDPRRGLEAMRTTGLMDEILPELSRTYGFRQGGMHNEDLYQHLLLALEAANEHGYPLTVKLAALFHDIGKVDTREAGEKREYTFYGHDMRSAEMTAAIFRRLKTSNEEREEVSHLIENHMFSYSPDWTDSAVRRFIRRVGIEEINPLFQLRVSDILATTGHRADPTMLLAFADRINAELDKENALSLKDLNIDGKKLIELGIPTGPAIGKILNTLLEEVIEDPSLNNEEYLEKRALSLSQAQSR